MINTKLPDKYTPYVAQSQFTTQFGIVNPNFWVFDNTVRNTGITIKQNSLYLIDMLEVSTNVSAEDYINTLLTVSTPKFNFKYSTADEKIYPRPIYVWNPFSQVPLNFWFFHEQKDTLLQTTFDGSFKMISNLIGLNWFSVIFKFVIYEISDAKFVERYLEQKSSVYYKELI